MLVRLIAADHRTELAPPMDFGPRVPAAGDLVEWRETLRVLDGQARYHRIETTKGAVRWVLSLPAEIVTYRKGN